MKGAQQYPPRLTINKYYACRTEVHMCTHTCTCVLITSASSVLFPGLPSWCPPQKSMGTIILPGGHGSPG